MPTEPTPSFIDDVIRDAGGIIPFRRFMQEALYHPVHGYYTAGDRTIGPRGDFSTGATLHNVLGEAIASWARKRARELFLRGSWDLIEVGAGSGQLAAAVIRSLGIAGRLRSRYRIVEISPHLRVEQRKRLRRFRVRWHDTVDRAVEAAGGRALLFSNELVDAFPCHLLARDRGKWREVHVAFDGDHPVERFGPMTDPRIETELCSLPRGFDRPADGDRCEVHLPYHDWLAGWVGRLRRGAQLTIDYGETVDRLRSRRSRGSVRAYFRHLTLTGSAVYGRVGRQDLTADVNFTDLRNWGEGMGLATRTLTTQREFLLARVAGLEARAETDPALGYLLHPSGAGTAFQVLDQVRE